MLKTIAQDSRNLTKSFLFATVLFFQLFSFASSSYPDGPELSMTPGMLCERHEVQRYPEGIDYCERDVNTQLKKRIIREYDEKFGYNIQNMNRGDFKIDHFIPLSIGGSNSIRNLWPQHKSISVVTDPVEHLLGERISQGRIKQAEAIRLIKEVKLNLSKAPEVLRYLHSL